MKKISLIVFFAILCLAIKAQNNTISLGSNADSRLTAMVERLTRFGQNIPQEKVYVHMDNTCYFVGDTIWYAAYTRSTHNNLPSALSGTLYVELYNQDGYLVERQLVEMIDGRGHGNFVLEKDCFGGFYELRAYTRWQLNWGTYEHKNATVSEQWFLSNDLHENYFKDYEKLYSRVFPVYDEPKKKGEYVEEMTMRPMRRYFKKEKHERNLSLNLYPEGGNVVAGLPCRVAYEAVWDDGERAELSDRPGRGILEITPKEGEAYEVKFTDKDGNKLVASLPKPQAEGVALRATQTDETWQFDVQLSAGLQPNEVALTVMHQGVVEKAAVFDQKKQTIEIRKTDLKEGVNQITIFDVQGRILADRLFFNMLSEGNHVDVTLESASTTSVENASFGAYAPISLKVESKPHAVLSMAVRDVAHSDILNDNATMRIEMLLASEIKGFVDNPQYYFEKDDEEHRQALDLLMMIQGWRRFNWQEMAIPNTFELTQPLERTPIIRGRVYENPEISDATLTDEEFIRIATTAGMYFANPEKGAKLLGLAEDAYNNRLEVEGSTVGQTSMDKLSGSGSDDSQSTTETKSSATKLHIQESENGTSITKDEEYERYGAKRNKNKKKELLVHLELVSTDGKDTRVMETMTKNGEFAFKLPGFYGNAFMFISASDSTKWDQKEKKNPAKHTWIQMKGLEEDLPEGHRNRFRVDPAEWTVRQLLPHPRFVKPYNFYQEQLIDYADPALHALKLQDGTTQMREVSIRANHGGMKRFSDSIPAFMIDAYDAYNYALDAGMFTTYPEDIARAYVGDYGHEFPYIPVAIPFSNEVIEHSNIVVRFGLDQTRRALNGITMDADSAYFRGNLASFSPYTKYGTVVSFLSYAALREYYQMSRLEKYVIYTDYQPRLAGDARYSGSNLPETHIAVYPYTNGSQRAFYRDRRYVQNGYNYADDFYHPNYQNRKTADMPKDYRRTLYWNPELKLDEAGEASVLLYNNSKPGQISVSVEGISSKGEILGN